MTREEEVKAAISYLKSYRKLDEATLKIAPPNSVAHFAANKRLEYWDMAIEALRFCEWVASEVTDEESWELNSDAFAEIACRKLHNLGIIEKQGNEWIYKEVEK